MQMVIKSVTLTVLSIKYRMMYIFTAVEGSQRKRETEASPASYS